MPSKDEGNGRQSPLTRAPEPEPDVATFVTALKQRDARGKRHVSPSQRRRQKRRMQITFSNSSIPNQLRALAEQWGMYTHTNALAVSDLVELLLLPQLEVAKQGQITLDDLQKLARGVVVDGEEDKSSSQDQNSGEQWF